MAPRDGLTLLDDAQKGALVLRRQPLDLLKEERAALRLGRLLRRRDGLAAAFLAAAVDADEGTAAALRAFVDGARERISAAARLAFDEDRYSQSGGAPGKPDHTPPIRRLPRCSRMPGKIADRVREQTSEEHGRRRSNVAFQAAMLVENGKAGLNAVAQNRMTGVPGLILPGSRPICDFPAIEPRPPPC